MFPIVTKAFLVLPVEGSGPFRKNMAKQRSTTRGKTKASIRSTGDCLCCRKTTDATIKQKETTTEDPKVRLNQRGNSPVSAGIMTFTELIYMRVAGTIKRPRKKIRKMMDSFCRRSVKSIAT